MLDERNVPEVGAGEKLARYILFSKHIRADRTIKPDAFIPHPRADLSVTRHLMAADDELWLVGHAVAREIERSLYGRGDIQAVSCNRRSLSVVAAPIPNNPNHANIIGWPPDKPGQKNIAQEIAAESAFVPVAPLEPK